MFAAEGIPAERIREYGFAFDGERRLGRHHQGRHPP